MGSSEKFLVDANTLITSYRDYYALEFTTNFWEQLMDYMNSGLIFVLDLVKEEIDIGNDPLSEWAKNMSNSSIINHKNLNIISIYGDILNYVKESACYRESALKEWSRIGVADPWLIAAGRAYDYTVITFEVSNANLNAKYPSREPKIPDVCNHFNVKVNNLYYMMRELNIHL